MVGSLEIFQLIISQRHHRLTGLEGPVIFDFFELNQLVGIAPGAHSLVANGAFSTMVIVSQSFILKHFCPSRA